MAVKLAEVDSRSKSNTHRLDEMDGRVDTLQRLTTAVEVMAKEQEHQTETMKEIKTDVSALSQKVDTLEKKPGKRWDGVVDKLIYGIVGALAAALFAGAVYLMTVVAA
jgi:phage I-like protein